VRKPISADEFARSVYFPESTAKTCTQEASKFRDFGFARQHIEKYQISEMPKFHVALIFPLPERIGYTTSPDSWGALAFCAPADFVLDLWTTRH
jgi:hypothetical protein